MKKILGIAFILLFVSVPLFAAPDSTLSSVTVHAYVDADNVPLNREVVFHVELTWQGDLNKYTFDTVNDPVVSNLKLRGSGSSNKVSLVNGKPQAMRSVTYYYLPQEIGMGYIDGATLTYTNSASGRQEHLITKRVSVKIGEPLPEKKKEFLPGSILLWSLLIGFFAAVAYAMVRFVQRRKQGLEAEAQKPLSLEEKYLSFLKNDIHPANNKHEDNLSAIYKLLTGYIGERFAIPDVISSEILKDRLTALHIDPELQARVIRLADKADKIRFAAEKADPADVHLFYDSVEVILKNNLQQPNTGEEK